MHTQKTMMLVPGVLVWLGRGAALRVLAVADVALGLRGIRDRAERPTRGG